MIQANLYAIFIPIIIGTTLYIIYKNRQKNISFKRFLLALFLSFLFFIIVGSFSVTLCYSNPNTLLIIFPFLVFLSIAIIESKKIMQQLVMVLVLEFIAMNVLFRSFTREKYTTSLTYIRDMNKIRKERGRTDTISAKPLWHTSFTGIYEVFKKPL